MQNKEYNVIDITKFVMALFVVAIHTRPFYGVEETIFIQVFHVVVRFAVPYFFIASGFFLFSKLNSADSQNLKLVLIKSYCVRIVKLYVYWTIIFLPITIWYFFNNEAYFLKDLLLFVRGFLFVGENYYSWPLWYLLSMIYSLILVYLLIQKKFKYDVLFQVSVILFSVSIIIDFILKTDSNQEFIIMIAKIIKMTIANERLFSGMIYIMIGGLMAQNNRILSLKKWVVLLILSLTFQVWRFPFLTPATFAIIPSWIFFITLNTKIEQFKHAYFFRKCSTVIYFLHMIVLFIYTILFKEFRYFGLDAFAICTLIPTVITPLIISCQGRYSLLRSIF